MHEEGCLLSVIISTATVIRPDSVLIMYTVHLQLFIIHTVAKWPSFNTGLLLPRNYCSCEFPVIPGDIISYADRCQVRPFNSPSKIPRPWRTVYDFSACSKVYFQVLMKSRRGINQLYLMFYFVKMRKEIKIRDRWLKALLQYLGNICRPWEKEVKVISTNQIDFFDNILAITTYRS